MIWYSLALWSSLLIINQLRNTEPATPVASHSIHRKLLFNETFEGNSPFQGAKLQASTSYGFSLVTTPVYEGHKAGRFELRDTDLETSGGTRTEFLFPEDTRLKEGWYSFAAYFPDSLYKIDTNMEFINQWHQGKGSGSPALMLMTEADQFKMFIGGDKRKHRRFVLGKVRKDAWHHFVIYVLHSAGENGLVVVWLNGKKVLSYGGPTMYAGYSFPRWKIGIYKDDWNKNETTASTTRVFYVDNVRMGSGHATFEDME